jgi:hypothetical protein
MSLKRIIFLTITSFYFITISLYSQQDSTSFKPSGSIIARAFLDYSNNFDDESGFDMTRAFLGYKYQITSALEAQVIIDGAAGTKDKRFDPYIRNAFIKWSDKGFDIHMGLTGLLQFSIQEKYWKHRYVLKSFQDLNSMAPSVDLGVITAYRFNKYISADISLTNGEGYKKISKDNSYRTAIGLSLHPIENSIFRIYGDIYNKTDKMLSSPPEGIADANFDHQYTLSLFAGYQVSAFSAGMEFNKVFNKNFIGELDYYGYSFYTSIKILPKWRVFARYDWMDSTSPVGLAEPWNEDNQLIMGGIEYQPLKQLKVAPNFRNTNPTTGKSEQALFVNVEFNL